MLTFGGAFSNHIAATAAVGECTPPLFIPAHKQNEYRTGHLVKAKTL
jgi:1-aminocyclopropane-1-carboxylate deaminase/D-cysteine desulfhydrase-like pyridoxal-dependent ACC family enzyme